MTYALAENVTCCIAGRRTVLLDLAKGKFFSPSTEVESAFQRWFRTQAPEDEDARQLDVLLNKGVLIRTAGKQRTPVCPAWTVLPVRSEFQVKDASSTQLNLLHAVATQLLWSWRTKHWPLSRLVAAVQETRLRVRDAALSDSRANLASIVRAFTRADLVLGCHDRCLVRSIAIGAAARARSLPVDVVIGVRAEPFVAHCWVQQGDIVINDNRERVRPFTPILVM